MQIGGSGDKGKGEGLIQQNFHAGWGKRFTIRWNWFLDEILIYEIPPSCSLSNSILGRYCDVVGLTAVWDACILYQRMPDSSPGYSALSVEPPINVPRTQQRVAQVLGFLPSRWETSWHLPDPALASCRLLENEPEDERYPFSPPPSLSACQIRKDKLYVQSFSCHANFTTLFFQLKEKSIDFL